MAKQRYFRPSVHVSRPVSPSIRLPYRRLERLAMQHNIEDLRFIEPRDMAATIINSREILELHKLCGIRLSRKEALRLGDLLAYSLPSTACEYVNVPLTLVKHARPIRDQPVRYSIIAAPCITATQERAVLQEVLTDIMVSCAGSLAAAQAIAYEWRPQVHGAQLAVSHNEASVDAFYDVLQGSAADMMPRSLVYKYPRVANVYI